MPGLAVPLAASLSLLVKLSVVMSGGRGFHHGQLVVGLEVPHGMRPQRVASVACG